MDMIFNSLFSLGWSLQSSGPSKPPHTNAQAGGLRDHRAEIFSDLSWKLFEKLRRGVK